ncbi:Cytochrome b5 domain-containing protein 1 [Lamellibrachia satsuma]|nr:Cytochrome b5 domain-containing protein 1 [Lamellibrachia satsuma]
MKEILDRYLMYNSHASSYTWKYDGRNLDIGMSLGNLIQNEDFYKLGMSDDLYLHAIHLYFKDDLTEV